MSVVPSPTRNGSVIDPEVLTAEQSSAPPASKPASKGKPLSKSKPSSKGKSSPSKKPSSASKKPASSTTKKITAPKSKSSKPNTDGKLSFLDMIKDAISNDKGTARAGISRNAIKKHLAIRFKVLETPTNLTHLNKAIKIGAEKGIFALPKGVSGKVKLAKPVTSTPAVKKVISARKPSSKTVKKSVKSALKKASKKPASLKSVTKKGPSAPSKKTATASKKVTGKKSSSTTKKVKAASKKA